MENIIEIFYVAIMIIAFIFSIIKKKSSSTEDALEEVFPEIKVEPEKIQETPSPKPQYQEVVVPNPDTQKPVLHTKTTPPSFLASSKPVQNVRINTRSEARKAFIYSEIFNRKY